MWSYAAHAGAGVAIAGITATYYALSRKNFQGEKESLPHENSFPDGNRLRRHTESRPLTASNLLLKREVEELANLNGSTSGINILYQQRHPLHKFNRSRFEMSPIISRTDTTLSESDGEELEFPKEKDEIVVGPDPNVEPSRKSRQTVKSRDTLDQTGNSTNSDKEDPKSQPRFEDLDERGGGDVYVSELTTYEDYKKQVLSSETIDDNATTEGDETDDTISSVNLGQKWKYIQETPLVARNTSPICFFKNPGFGNRSPLVNLPSTDPPKRQLSKEVLEIVKQDNADGASEISTEFILSPVLSESNVSECPDENPELLIKRRKKSSRRRVEKAIVETNPVEEMSEYNKRLELSRVRENSESRCNLHGTPTSVHLPSKVAAEQALHVPATNSTEIDESSASMESGDKTSSTDDSLAVTVVDPLKMIELEEDGSGVFEEPLKLPSVNSKCRVRAVRRSNSCRRLNKIPRNSWIGYPARLFASSWQFTIPVPWALMMILIMVVIIAGFLITIMSVLANNVNQRHLRNDDII